MSGLGAAADLLIIADSPERQDLKALLGLFNRVLGAEVPYLFLTYSARRADEGGDCERCLNKPFRAEELIERIRRLTGQEEKERAAEPQPREPETILLGEPPERAPRVLVAEDNQIAAKVITALLARQGLDVTLVQDGQAALERVSSESFAMAFVDLRMPRIDGISFTRAYRASEAPGAHLPIIALTANAAQDVKAQCLQAGMDGFLGKPVKPEELAEMVSRHARPEV
jgi:two-component system sensor histidine kinase RpfC